MKIRNLLIVVSMALFLPSCNSEEKVNYLPHDDYDPQKSGTVCRSNLYNDEHYYYDICNNMRILPENQYSSVSPFDTAIYVRYSADRLSTSAIEEIETIFGSEMVAMHKLFDNNYHYLDGETRINNLRVINESYGSGERIAIDERLYDILNISRDMMAISRGRFNIFVGELSDFWMGAIEEARDEPLTSLATDPTEVPEAMVILEKLIANVPQFGGTSLDDLSYDELYAKFDSILKLENEEGSYYATFNKIENVDSLKLTLGAIGKGYATSIARDALIAKGYSRGIIYGGGSSIVTLGDSYREKEWRLSVVNPLVRNETLGLFRMTGVTTYSTSGDQERGFVYNLHDEDGNVTGTVRRHHIIDPISGYPLTHYRTVCALTPLINSGIGDAISTTLMNIGPGDSFSISDFESRLKEFYEDDFSMEYCLFSENIDGSLMIDLTENFNESLSISTAAKYTLKVVK